MKRIAAFLAVAVLAAVPVLAADPELKTEDEKTLYTLGVVLGQRATPLGLTEAELAIVKSGFTDGALAKTLKVDLNTYGPKITAYAQERVAKVQAPIEAAEKKKGAEFLAKVEKEPGAKKTASGLIYKLVEPGTGDSPKATDKVKVKYTGKLIDGTVFDSSDKHPDGPPFALNAVVACWTEGMQLLKPGGKATLYCPSDLGWGSRGSGDKIKPGATVVFDVELIEVVK